MSLKSPSHRSPSADSAKSYDVAIIGAGFAGSILARVLARRGLRVLLLERQHHPRFALGESSTPLAALSLERLARRYDLPDLADLATYGRWDQHHPQLRKGLKRGFSFFRHQAPDSADAIDFADSVDRTQRMLVAASPNDAVADCHWRRADVDDYLFRQAAREGVEAREGCHLQAIERVERVAMPHGGPGTEKAEGGAGWRLKTCSGESQREDEEVFEAVFLVDASGSHALASQLEVTGEAHEEVVDRNAALVDTCLVANHLQNVPRWEGPGKDAESLPGGAGVSGDSVSSLPWAAFSRGAPYPVEQAAVHHLLDEGWVYALRFDDGVVSVGAELLPSAARELLGKSSPQELGPEDGEALWRALCLRYPVLRDQFADGDAKAVEPWICRPKMQHRRTRAVGLGWLALPHAYSFVSPLFSTGIAWSLIGVERAASLLAGIDEAASVSDPDEGHRQGRQGRQDRQGRQVRDAGLANSKPGSFAEYGRLLDVEARWIERLVAGALKRRRNLDSFSAWSLLYFAAASWSEARQRLVEAKSGEDWAWSGFLGSDDPAFQTALALAEAAPVEVPLFEVVAPALRERDVGGWSRPPEACGVYPVDFEALVAAAPLLGLTEARLRAALPRLRGDLAPVDAPLMDTEMSGRPI